MSNQTIIPTKRSPKRLPAVVTQRARTAGPIIVVLLIIAVFFQTRIDPTRRQLQGPENATAIGGLNNEFLLLPLLGFREAAAGLLWVRCDEFFHSGDYDAILPLVRVITLLDPHADNVYITGAWHLAYNFTDANERSDRRYIPPSQALLDEGIKNNKYIADIKFEKGWQLYDKVHDYVAAAAAFENTIDTPAIKNISPEYPWGAPLKTLHILAHTYEKEGRIPEALAEWQAAMDRSAKQINLTPNDYADKQLREAEKHNYAETLQRYHDRYTKIDHDKTVNATNYPAVAQPDGGRKTPGPWDVAMHAHIVVKPAHVLKISGDFNSADGARVNVLISDWNYTGWPIGGTKVNPKLETFDIDTSQTVLMDTISVRKNHFERQMDMSKDPKMYGFFQPDYKIVLDYSSRNTAPHLQDRFGWNGEGLTDSDASHIYINKNPLMTGTKMIENADAPGAVWDGNNLRWAEYTQPPRTLRMVYKVTRAQMEGKKPITDADLVPNASVP